MSSVLKKRKIADERRVFKKNRRICIFSPQLVIKESHCLTCQKKIAVMKEYNLRRHYEAMHQDKYDGYKGNARKEKVKQLKLSLCKQKSFLANINHSNENSERTSLNIGEMIAKSSWPFTEGLFVKECLLKASEILCPNQKKLFKGISLSPNTVASRVMDLAVNVEKQLLATAMDFEVFSIALDKSTDSSGTA